MKKSEKKWGVIVCLFCLMGLIVLCGCETVKGMGRDIKNADDWLREHAW